MLECATVHTSKSAFCVLQQLGLPIVAPAIKRSDILAAIALEFLLKGAVAASAASWCCFVESHSVGRKYTFCVDEPACLMKGGMAHEKPCFMLAVRADDYSDADRSGDFGRSAATSRLLRLSIF